VKEKPVFFLLLHTTLFNLFIHFLSLPVFDVLPRENYWGLGSAFMRKDSFWPAPPMLQEKEGAREVGESGKAIS
jgi:hypothetical protein